MTFKQYQLSVIEDAFNNAMKNQDNEVFLEGLVNALACACNFLTRADNLRHWDDEIEVSRVKTFGMPWNEVKRHEYKKTMAEMVRDQGFCTADYLTIHEGKTYSQVNGRVL